MSINIEKNKKIAENIFKSLDTSISKDGVIGASVTEITTDKEEFAKAKALEELETIRLAFIRFQDEVRDSMMFNYMTSSFQQFADYTSDLMEMIEDDIDESKLTPDSLKKYKSIKKLRAQILSVVYNKYKA